MTHPLTTGTVVPANLPVASFFMRHISGWRGRAVAGLQGFVRGGSYWTHAGLIVDGGWAVQAQPGGARLFPVGQLLDGQPLLISDAPVQVFLSRLHEGNSIPLAGCHACQSMEVSARLRVAAAGRHLVGTGYSYLDYPTLGIAELAHAHEGNRSLRWLADRLRKRVNTSGHLICSAAVDRAYLNGGVHLFANDRLDGDVTPEDLAVYAYADGRLPLLDTTEGRF